MITRNNITQLSIPVEEFGTHGLVYLNATEAKLKSERKRAFKSLRSILLLYKIVDAKDIVHSIARGLTADGIVTVEVTTTEVKHETH